MHRTSIVQHGRRMLRGQAGVNRQMWPGKLGGQAGVIWQIWPTLTAPKPTCIAAVEAAAASPNIPPYAVISGPWKNLPLAVEPLALPIDTSALRFTHMYDPPRGDCSLGNGSE